MNLKNYLENEKRYDIETLSIDRILDKEHFYGQIIQKMCISLELAQPLHAINYVKTKIF